METLYTVNKSTVTSDNFTFCRSGDNYKQEPAYNKFVGDNKHENQTYNKNFNEIHFVPSNTCIIGKRSRNTQFGDNSDCEIIEETDDDGEGKKCMFKRMKRKQFNNKPDSNQDTNCYTAHERIGETVIQGSQFATSFTFTKCTNDQTTTADNENSTDTSVNATPNIFLNNAYLFDNSRNT